jgi:glycosyltransferase involved in cell wall biosynthesis
MTLKEPRILFFTSGHSPFSARLFFRELKSLQKKFSDLAIIAPFEDNVERKENIRIIGVRKRRSRYNRFMTYYDLYRRGLKYEPDVIHCHEPDSLFIALLLKRKISDVRVIYDCHEFHPEGFTENLPGFIRKLLQKLIERIENFMASKADAIITVNERLVNRFSRQNDTVVLLPNYPPLAIFDNEKRGNGLSNSGKVRLIYIGGLTVDRGIFKMIELVKRLSSHDNLKLILIGNFSTPKLEQQFWHYAHELEVANKVDHKGYLPHEQTVKYLMKSDLGICLIYGRQRYEWTEFIKYFEYSAAGLPVVASDLAAIKKLVVENKNGLAISVHDLDGAATALNSLLINTAETKKMAERSIKAFQEKYNWEAIEPRLFELYSRLT